MSDIQNGILGVLEARGGLVHRLDIMGDLPTFKQASVDAYLSEMAKTGVIRRPKKATTRRSMLTTPPRPESGRMRALRRSLVSVRSSRTRGRRRKPA